MSEDESWTLREKEKDHDIEKGDVSPNAGGCWICHKKEGEMLFDMEFDTYYHSECLEKTGYDSILEYETRNVNEEVD